MIRTLSTIAALLLAAPAAAAVSLGLELTIPAQRLGVDRMPGLDRPLRSPDELGATLLLRAGALGLGVAATGAFESGGPTRYDASVLLGVVTDLLPVLRLELLGELGAASVEGAEDLRRAVAGDGGHFYGFRPGLSARLPALPFRVGVWGLARWNLPGAGPGASYGLLGRVGLEF